VEETDRSAERPDRVSVRPVAEDEYEAVLPLISGYQRFYEAEPEDERNRTFFRRFLTPSDDGILLGAWAGPELVEFSCVYWTYSSVHAAEVGLLNDLYVEESARGRGVGEALIDASAEAARARGARHLEWLTHVDNRQAQRLYERFPADRSAWFGYELPLQGKR
jgi:GNAT superfamily N-acetyltransferase